MFEFEIIFIYAVVHRFFKTILGPLSPVIQEFKPIPYGLNISWQSDVNSVQDLYQVIYVRNDTGEKVTQKTMETKLIITDLYPGARYVNESIFFCRIFDL